MGKEPSTTRIVLAIHSRHAQAILEGEKTHELRKRLPRLSRGDVVYLYETAPTSSIVGGFVVDGVRRDTPARTWRTVGNGFAITKPEFDGYVNGSEKVIALKVSGAFRLKNAVTKNDLAALAVTFTPPQSAVVVRDPTLVRHLDTLAKEPLSQST